MTFLNPFKRSKYPAKEQAGGSKPAWHNNHPSSAGDFGRRPDRTPKPEVAEDTIASNRVQIERKSFLLSLKENPRGRFLRITEESGGRHNSVIIPATGLADFLRVLTEMTAEGSTPKPEEPA